ncbi:unnamed protein product [Dicrocoelium dendriticum]|nr:unnamed protein product [Dicrocoelium dendriticum]
MKITARDGNNCAGKLCSNNPNTCARALEIPDIKWCRFSPYEKLCINLLSTGYHETFTELAGLVKRQMNTLREAEPMTPALMIPLSENPEKLNAMLPHLIHRENATRIVHYDEVYRRNWALANLFRGEPEYQSFVGHFLKQCNSIAKKNYEMLHMRSQTQTPSGIQDDDTSQLERQSALRYLAESTYLLMKHHVESGDNDEAIRLAHILHDELSFDKEMLVPPNDPDAPCVNAPRLLNMLCETMARCYLQRGDAIIPLRRDEAVATLIKALDYAVESGNQSIVGTCLLRISRLYEEQDNPELAYKYAEEYHQLSKKLENDHQINACRLMVDIHEKLKDARKVKLYLGELQRITTKCGDPLQIAEADVLLTRFYARQLEDYEKSKTMAEDGFHLAMRTTNHELERNLRLWCGYINGCRLKSTFLPVVLCAEPDKKLMFSLLNWRIARTALDKLTPTQEREITRCTFHERAETIDRQRAT